MVSRAREHLLIFVTLKQSELIARKACLDIREKSYNRSSSADLNIATAAHSIVNIWVILLGGLAGSKRRICVEIYQ